MFDVQETQLSKMVNFANIPKMVTFSNRMRLFLVTAKQFTFCCFLLERGSRSDRIGFMQSEDTMSLPRSLVNQPHPDHKMPPQWWANDFGCKDKPQISCFFLYENLTSMFFPGFLLQYQFCRDGSSSPGRRQNIVKPCLPETFAKLADLFMSSSNASLLKLHAWYIKFLDDLNDNLQQW